ncbi:hypothetical protein E4U30_000801 [Claviceps sp. LM220 group G6]|nr:hypothetical protein E4U30_000801 [Claviceps sp. LM220 group G6]
MMASSLLSHTNGSKPKPHILACASPITGHTLPIVNIVDQLIQRGYSVTFLAGWDFKDRIESIGATFVGLAPFDMVAFQKERSSCGSWPARATFAIRAFCIEPVRGRKEALYAALEQAREAHPEKEFVILTETFFLGDQPLFLGAELPRGFRRRPRSVNIHAVPYMIESQDMAPMGWGLVPEKTEEGRQFHRSLWEELRTKTFAEVITLQEKNLKDLGGVRAKADLPFTVVSVSADVTLQLCPPSLEFGISDLHPRVRFAGALQGRGLNKEFEYPSFWPDVTRGDRKVIVVTQGTVAVEYRHLLIPALNALAHRRDILVIAILGKRGARLPVDVTIPPNTHVIDYLPYNAILPHAAVFVMNAGYGGVIQGMLHGVPMVLAGGTEDKPEVAARAEHAGIAVNLRTGKPEEEHIAQAVNLVLRHGRFKRRVMEVRQENEAMKTIDLIEGTILEMAEAE